MLFNNWKYVFKHLYQMTPKYFKQLSKSKGKNKRSTWDNDNDANFIEIKTFEPFFNFLK